MKAVISAYARSPFHFAKKGALADVRPDTLTAGVVKGLLQRTDLDPALLEDIILGCAYPEASQGNNLARIVGLLAGLPHEVGGMTVNRFCGSSMQAVHIAAAQIEAGMGDAFLCVGVESMTAVPQGGFNFSPSPELLANTDAYISMGETAENVARRWNVSRADQEAFAVESHRKAAAARAEGRLAGEIVPVRLASGDIVDADGCIRPSTSAEALANLKPAFRPDGVVTAGTSSPLTDGAAVVLVTSDAFAAQHGLQALARIRSFATVGVDPAIMGIGPIPATRKALARAGLSVADLDVIEINEAFSSQALACIRDLGLDPAKINLDGGGLAIGHPLGATGARITGKAASLLAREKGRYALATQCIGGGQGIATILERV
ncbi:MULTISPECIES: thiolase family protein [Variovorax]|jgi:acetyl-CoA acyltransferase|uniref:thiolase family protein n=1 Tax=Variovorax TaxID=34072 RepID=UPI00086E0E9B|nr:MULTISPECIES: thiolase family protein [Variovorax]MBN8753401.1 thiolase family protein [Variovorax sp.]ODU15688.1 MAG: acetyl-CoA acetyltransferase [Variovorax sp. SCN 67-85]ODV27638.1 MAG: acetyl-CoA acetyltransferase [Variovorax sp. SCN 67-20]OJZ11523.1 MAG: acetyl-CoA acetyltransferase [Variovorax sp. 67-131]UKI05828.1 thiolase family protein [Variovorax paradoxus]